MNDWQDHINAEPQAGGYKKQASTTECPSCHKEVPYLIGTEDKKTHKSTEPICEECFGKEKV